MELPPIKLNEMSDSARDWLLSKCASGRKSPTEVIREHLEASAQSEIGVALASSPEEVADPEKRNAEIKEAGNG